MPRPAVAAMASFLEKELRPWTVDVNADLVGIPKGAREEAARVIGARSEDITLVGSTSAGLVTVANGLHLQAGDEILVPLGEFPSNVWPWLALSSKGVQFREVPLWNGHTSGALAWESAPPTAAADPEQRLLDALTPRTRVLAVSWVRFQDGLILDLAKLGQGCRNRGVQLVVDGIQGAGVAMPQLQWADAFATGGQKGLLGPQGTGFLWTHAALREQLSPQGSWLSVEDAMNFERPNTDLRRSWLTDGRRHEAGSSAVLSLLGFRESLKVLNQAGVAEIAAHVDALSGQLLAGLAKLAPFQEEAARLAELRKGGRIGPLVCLHHSGRGKPALGKLWDAGRTRGILTSIREGYLRIALHGFHLEEDVERVLAWLRSTASDL